MGEYEPDDSRTVTQSPHQAPGEPPRTGPREDEARARALQDQLKDKGEDKTAHNAMGGKEKGFAQRPDDDDAESSVPIGK